MKSIPQLSAICNIKKKKAQQAPAYRTIGYRRITYHLLLQGRISRAPQQKAPQITVKAFVKR